MGHHRGTPGSYLRRSRENRAYPGNLNVGWKIPRNTNTHSARGLGLQPQEVHSTDSTYSILGTRANISEYECELLVLSAEAFENVLKIAHRSAFVEKMKILAQVFHQFDNHTQIALCNIVKYRTYKTGHILDLVDKETDQELMYIVSSGRVAIECQIDGKRQCLTTRGRGMLVGESNVHESSDTLLTTARCTAPTGVIRIPVKSVLKSKGLSKNVNLWIKKVAKGVHAETLRQYEKLMKGIRLQEEISTLDSRKQVWKKHTSQERTTIAAANFKTYSRVLAGKPLASHQQS